jgi:hypothetical protein
MLSPNEMRNAIYLDFEGEGKKRDGSIPRPRLAGIFRPNHDVKGGKYACVFFNEKWKPASNGISSAKCTDFITFFNEIASELEERNAYLIYWTIHESLILEQYLDGETYARLKPRLYNLHPDARRYANKRRLFGEQGGTRGRPLEEFFAAMFSKRNPYPPFPLGAAEACRRIDKACNTNNKWKRFSEKQKGYVRDLVTYNQGDCRSTWLIAKKLGNAYKPRSAG